MERPKVATEYDRKFLQPDRPQPMYDRQMNRLYREVFLHSPAENSGLEAEFKEKFLGWMKADRLNRIAGLDEFQTDICSGCTQFIDDLYQTEGADKIMILSGDYKYHWRLNNQIRFHTPDTLEAGKVLLIAMPFPFYGDRHPDMDLILQRCLELNIPVHIDAAWLGCSRDIEFDFAHPAIKSFAISLSKAMGTGGNRIGLRFTRDRKPGPITIMNDFQMNLQSPIHIGIHFIDKLGPNYFWNKYGEAYMKVCRDFDLAPTKAIHLAREGEKPVGVRLLLRYLADK